MERGRRRRIVDVERMFSGIHSLEGSKATCPGKLLPACDVTQLPSLMDAGGVVASPQPQSVPATSRALGDIFGQVTKFKQTLLPPT